jgi:hypothetical protein
VIATEFGNLGKPATSHALTTARTQRGRAVQDIKSLWRWYRYGYEKELTK